MEILGCKKLLKYIKDEKKAGKSITLIPTMGNLHLGHKQLIKVGMQNVDKNGITNISTTSTMVSLFVNRNQFNNSNDFTSYPRKFDTDKNFLQLLNVDALFFPLEKEFFPESVETKVSISGSLSTSLCAENRPGHFDGVATVVTKLLSFIRPEFAVFGLKDYQQWLIINKLVKDLSICTKLIGIPTFRDNDAIALSSRLTLLSAKEKENAKSIFPALQTAVFEYKKGTKSVQNILDNARQSLIPYVKNIEYLEFRDCRDLALVSELYSKNARLFIATNIGKVRLIDNVPVYEDKIIYTD